MGRHISADLTPRPFDPLRARSEYFHELSPRERVIQWAMERRPELTREKVLEELEDITPRARRRRP